MGKIIQQLSKKFDLVIIDSPAMLAVTDAAVLASLVDFVALVVCWAKTSSGDLRATLDQLGKIKVKSIGVIENQVEHKKSNYYYYKQKKDSNNQ
jgi:Mrp family chromosome partitioning ATPase